MDKNTIAARVEELNKASAVVESEEFLATIEKAVDLSIQY